MIDLKKPISVEAFSLANEPTITEAPLRACVAGLDQNVPVINGLVKPYINLDNAASTPPFKAVLEALAHFVPYYSSVHRGSGFKSRISTEAYDQAHEIIAHFVGADTQTNTVIFGKNATEALNKLANRFPFKKDDVILTTLLEHHSNDLPWRPRAKVVHVAATPEGQLDQEDLERQLARYAGRVALVTVTGASNVTGFTPPIHEIARKVHAAGGKILVDTAQLAPHRAINMKPDDDPEHLDFVVLSAHKMYAPFGTGALIGNKEVFLQSAPDYRGGGTVEFVSRDEVIWAGLPDRDEAGSPNVMGAVAMAIAAKELMRMGMHRVAEHERELGIYALEKLQGVARLKLYGDLKGFQRGERVGVIPFNLAAIPHSLVAAILGFEQGIGVRSGCFCAQPYVAHLLGLTPQLWRAMAEQKQQPRPGMVRVSLGAYNTRSEIDDLVESLDNIAQGRVQGQYQFVHGDYLPLGYKESRLGFFSLLDDADRHHSAQGW